MWLSGILRGSRKQIRRIDIIVKNMKKIIRIPKGWHNFTPSGFSDFTTPQITKEPKLLDPGWYWHIRPMIDKCCVTKDVKSQTFNF
jgi:hypothetical protein